MDDFLELAGKKYRSRLLVGTGRYRSADEMKSAVEASGAEIVTVSVRRADLSATGAESIASLLPPSRYTYLPNSAGCYSAEEAVRTLRLAREMGGWSLVKLEVIADAESLLPDVAGTLRATKMLVAEGFSVMAYTTDDPEGARALADAGAAAVMPLGSPIGSGQGIGNPGNIARIAASLKVPVLVDAGIGTASDACIAMELGCAGVLLNTAIAEARDPAGMARAMKSAVEAGRAAYLAGRMPRRAHAAASSPETGKVTGSDA